MARCSLGLPGPLQVNWRTGFAIRWAHDCVTAWAVGDAGLSEGAIQTVVRGLGVMGLWCDGAACLVWETQLYLLVLLT